MVSKRKNHTEEMKARVALEAVKGVRTLSELSVVYGVSAEIFQKSYKSGDGVVFLFAPKLALARYLHPSLNDLPVIAIHQNAYTERGDTMGTAALQAFKSKNTRLWLVLRHSELTKRYKTITDMTVAWLDTNFKKVEEWKLKNLQMTLYESR